MIDLRNGITVADLLSLAGLAIVVAIVVELLKRTFEWSEATTKRFGPAASCAAGILLGVLAAIYLSGDVAQAALTGLLAGALASGIFDVASEPLASLLSRLGAPKGGAPGAS